MSTITFNLKRNDTLPVISIAVLNSDGDAYDFSDAVGATFLMVEDSDDRAEKVSATGNIEPGSVQGLLTYQFDPEDTDTAGRYIAEFQVEFATGDFATFPESGYIHIVIEEDLDDA